MNSSLVQQVTIAASGSALRKSFAYLLQSIRRAKDRTEKVMILGLEALPLVPELRTVVKGSDDNLYGWACTDFIACGSCNKFTDKFCQSTITNIDTWVVRGIAKQQQSNNNKAAKRQ